MENMTGFDTALQNFVKEKTKKEADTILSDKDLPRSQFNLENLRKFSYKTELDKFQKNTPLLLAAIIGSITKDKVNKYSDISRKGFGGPNSSNDIDLVPSVVQTVSRILKNRHPRSLSTIPCINSLYLWSNRVPGHIFHLYNSLGDSYRLANKYCSAWPRLKLDIKIVHTPTHHTRNFSRGSGLSRRLNPRCKPHLSAENVSG